jgi:hypothetical protein
MSCVSHVKFYEFNNVTWSVNINRPYLHITVIDTLPLEPIFHKLHKIKKY